MALGKEGSIGFWIGNPDSDWMSNTKAYNLVIIDDVGFSIVTTKSTDGFLHIHLAGPYDQTFSFKVDVPDQLVNPGWLPIENAVQVFLIWENGKVKLHLQKDLVQELEAVDVKTDILPITLATNQSSIELLATGSVIESLGLVFNVVSAFITARNADSVQAITQFHLDRRRFRISETSTGSIKSKVEGVKEVFDLLRGKLHTLCALLTGYANRLGEAYTIKAEAEANIALEQANQEKIKTLKEAKELISIMKNDIMALREDVPDEIANLLLQEAFVNPLMEISHTITDNGMMMSIEERSTDTAQKGKSADA